MDRDLAPRESKPHKSGVRAAGPCQGLGCGPGAFSCLWSGQRGSETRPALGTHSEFTEHPRTQLATDGGPARCVTRPEPRPPYRPDGPLPRLRGFRFHVLLTRIAESDFTLCPQPGRGGRLLSLGLWVPAAFTLGGWLSCTRHNPENRGGGTWSPYPRGRAGPHVSRPLHSDPPEEAHLFELRSVAGLDQLIFDVRKGCPTVPRHPPLLPPAPLRVCGCQCSRLDLGWALRKHHRAVRSSHEAQFELFLEELLC